MEIPLQVGSLSGCILQDDHHDLIVTIVKPAQKLAQELFL